MSIARAAGKLSIITKKKHLLLLFSNPSPLSPPQSHLRSPNFNFNFSYYYTTIRNNNNEYDDDDDDNETTRTRDHHPKHQSDPPHPIPNRPLRAPRGPDRDRDRDRFRDMPPTSSRGPAQVPPLRNEVSGRPNNHPNNFTTKHKDLGLGGIHHKPPATATATATATRDGESTAKAADSFLQKFKLGFDAKETTPPQSTPTTQQIQDPSPPPPQDADDIFKKMKENGLIPNAVAMLDGLCKDGLVQEAMKLFGLMREKGTIPEVVIYTAVVQGFCTAHKFDDAKRIFRKMQNNGVSPNAFTYTVLIQGLCKGGTLQDALDFSIEMLESGHSPNVATFTALIDGFCKEKGVEEAQGIIRKLREKSFFVNEKAVREHLDKKGPFSPLVWEAVFGKRSSQTLF